ncbi:hypothetical protein CHL67_01195 [Prosthecochloris sp. GSB1]|uniref:aminoglycoside phosphotransferase family protein n=1 Tax=Prosthecochloris sp. GSB1 TaxID=281093 RepID=UPI000B8CDF6E|nr:phosphotransferase [Prosthecochloris sp. GSB1]ASQ89719.1 hypothetical protein CHL67_01195 [Prosthecochloris sp. GSB1]
MPFPQQQLGALFHDAVPDDIRIEPIAGDASSRRYFRIFSSHSSWILCIDDEFRAFQGKNYPFLAVQELLRSASVPVPEVLGCDKPQGMILLEDCGSIMLRDIARQHPGMLRSAYRNAVETMVAIQSVKSGHKSLPFDRLFDEEKLMFEFNFFLDNAPENAFAEKTVETLRKEFLAITRRLVLPGHFVLNHRDYHSRNILLKNRKPVIIDFQDARMGLPQYDAASLLRDSYVTLHCETVDELQRYHYDLLRQRRLTSMSRDEYLYLFDIMAFQRNVKALGTFFHQSFKLGKKEFGSHISPTLAYFPDYISRHPELETSGRIILNQLAGMSS